MILGPNGPIPVPWFLEDFPNMGQLFGFVPRTKPSEMVARGECVKHVSLIASTVAAELFCG
jgi:hypothetical protein